MTIEYFDGREWDNEIHTPKEMAFVDRDAAEFMPHSSRVIRKTTISIDPPTRAVYPREVETIDEAKELWVSDEITIHQFERYLERLMDRTRSTNTHL